MIEAKTMRELLSVPVTRLGISRDVGHGLYVCWVQELPRAVSGDIPESF